MAKNSEIIYDAIIVGGGAAGLMAAWELAMAGKQVLLLEGKERLGGRIHTIYDNGFDRPVELGAEFIHGELPTTFDLSRRANAPFYRVDGEFWRHRNGKFDREEDEIEDDKRMESALEHLKADMPVQEFLTTNFSAPKDAEVYQSIKSYVEGYYSADTNKASTFYLRDEWDQGDSEQFRTEGGYQVLIDFLVKQCTLLNIELRLNAVVTEIMWQENQCKVVVGPNAFQSNKVVITASIGVLQTEAIRFSPVLPNITKAFADLGFGEVIKILLQFDETFWVSNSKKLSKMAFLFSEQNIPTWWTQFPKKSGLLTGWISGPKATASKHLTDEELIEQGFDSLSNIFNLRVAELKQKCKKSIVSNWCIDPFVLGGYSYETITSKSARKIINEGVDQTIYFAGEGLYEGLNSGTVEAALSSGRETARRIISDKNGMIF